jgi:hypothetical protein
VVSAEVSGRAGGCAEVLPPDGRSVGVPLRPVRPVDVREVLAAVPTAEQDIVGSGREAVATGRDAGKTRGSRRAGCQSHRCETHDNKEAHTKIVGPEPNIRHGRLTASASSHQTRKKALRLQGFYESGRRDSNSGPLVPQTSALTRLRHAPRRAPRYQASRDVKHPRPRPTMSRRPPSRQRDPSSHGPLSRSDSRGCRN